MWSECRWVRKALFILLTSSPLTGPPYLGDSAAAFLIRPGPKSTIYGVSSTAIATEQPERFGSGFGVPVPSNMTLVVPESEESFCAAEVMSVAVKHISSAVVVCDFFISDVPSIKWDAAPAIQSVCL